MSLRRHFDKELLFLHQEILKMGVLVEERIGKALDALLNNDRALAGDIIREDKVIDKMEIDIEDHCIRLIAQEQPIASDLRTVITTLKIVSHLERMGDHAVHLAKGALRIANEDGSIPLQDISRMGSIVLNLLPEALNAFVNKNREKALQIAEEDDKIDTMHTQLIREMLSLMKVNPANIEQAINLLFISRFLERLGDHVVDICEWIIYNITGSHPDLKN